jgi:hypothetical protein
MPDPPLAQNSLRKLAIISMTAVVMSDRRIARASQAKEAYQSQFPAIGSGEMSWAINNYFQTLHDPTLLYLDEMIPGAKSHLDALVQQGYQVVLVSPLPETSREPLRAWFADHGIFIASPSLAVLGLDWLALCSRAMRGNLHDWYYHFYERDLEFKVRIVEMLVNLWEVEQVLYVDPSDPCRLAIETADMSSKGELFLAVSLEDAVALVKEG